MDALKSNALIDQHCDADGGVDMFRDSDSDTENDLNGACRKYPPPAYDKVALTSKEAQPTKLAANFYKVLSPAHRIERDLELYLNQKIPTSINLKLQVKIIFDKPKERFESESSSSATAAATATAATTATAAAAASSSIDFTKVQVDNSSGQRDVESHQNDVCDDVTVGSGEDDIVDDVGRNQIPHTLVIDLTDDDSSCSEAHNDTNQPNESTPLEDENATAKRNAEALRNLLESVSKSILMRKSRLTARNIKVQENNDSRTYSTSFISLPTLNPRTLALEALSVVSMGPAQIREEAWKELRALQFTANLRNNNPKKKC